MYVPELETLTLMQEDFCINYVRYKNATKAAKLAGYSPESARSIGSENLTKPAIMARIGELTIEMGQASYMDAEKVIRNLSLMANADIRKLYDDNGALLPVCDWDDDTAFAVTGLDVEEVKVMGMTIGEVKKIKMADKRAANVDLGKHFGIFEKDNKQKQTIVFVQDEDDANL